MSVNYQYLNLLPTWCFAAGVRHAVICSGSRSAPLSLSFGRYDRIACITAIDERSAGYLALGMAQISKSPVVVIVTSGTALVNLFPSVAEAYYSHTPLIIISADRPSDMQNRYEGQTLMQQNVFGNHVLASLQAPECISNKNISFVEEKIKDLFNRILQIRKGPVHLNIPFKEPFYPKENHFIYKKSDWIFKSTQHIKEEITLNFNPKNILYIAGRDEKNTSLEKLLDSLPIAILPDITSNMHSKKNITYFEAIIRLYAQSIPAPDLIISSGRGLVSKILKNYIASFGHVEHIYIAEQDELAEPIGTATQIFNGNRLDFFDQLKSKIIEGHDYINAWKVHSKNASNSVNHLILEQPFCEFTAMGFVFQSIPENYVLHLANSMSVRWGQIFSYQNHTIFSNRGVSGIDGCTSSAVGAAMVDNRNHILVCGDVSFFYDLNAFWQISQPENLKIVVLNNDGGGIFRLIDGASEQPEIESLFAMPRPRSIKLSAESFGVHYLFADSESSLKSNFEQLIRKKGITILEIATDKLLNGQVFDLYKKMMF